LFFETNPWRAACQDSTLGSKHLAGIARRLFTYHETDLIASSTVPDPARDLHREFKLPQIAKHAVMNLRTYRPDLTRQNIVVKNVTTNLKELKDLFLANANIVEILFLLAHLNREFIAA
jgi:hypothetical protein